MQVLVESNVGTTSESGMRLQLACIIFSNRVTLTITPASRNDRVRAFVDGMKAP